MTIKKISLEEWEKLGLPKEIDTISFGKQSKNLKKMKKKLKNKKKTSLNKSKI